ncbi:hypothetical protein TREMEDRAFT_64564 [Tremella mesenterica DSM 1558]|uniref:uncharacterized protein n=1 Tax=Tremella mesenterica (strain ATCC 24925 / CBS 8224 / DSM 1558 / NBRC 9311 / NRRL Y-6157 / RJB 2259-6 / UBC 559-6) TaxID=578456 RepID=UPI0003F4A08A|nr:uncharacterized protein TREMEDRAFT_64564 [Tremella mesenterica DSM 1558]EIW67315.1 hypothetical protein TREMEDRAFT_64564 [Tremella mesenterica DSM 1558]
MVYRPGKQATLPDGLSRRADYHSGKGSTMVQESNLMEGLPKFDELDDTSSGLQHLLRALQGTKEVRENDLIDPMDLIVGIQEDEEVEEVREELLGCGVDVSLGQGTRRGTTANYAVVIGRVSVSVVRVEVGDDERKVGDEERRVGDGGCQGCYDVVRDSRPLLRRERPLNFVEVHRGCLLLPCGNYVVSETEDLGYNKPRRSSVGILIVAMVFVVAETPCYAKLPAP